ncbi:MAG: InlB B-repeat-containing protein [Bacteroidales bacterium]|nr:InlB B-repeat-containing protein [Bacteroidales bacterium]
MAHFQQQQQQYTISVSANPSNGGNVSGGGTFNQGASCTVHATAKSGYTFIKWTENGAQVSTNANYTFTVSSNRSLVAHFQQQQQQYTITVSANPSNGGNVSGGGTFNQGASCTVHAIANSGYTFVNWTENGTQVSTNANYTFTVSGNRSLVAHFQQQQQQYSISVTASPSNGGVVSGGGTFNQGASCTVHATVNSGFTFVNWTENGTQVSTNANYSFTVTGNRELVANFVQSEHTIQATAGANGIITPSGIVTVTHGANQSFAMIPDTGYEVQDVYIDGNPVGAITSYTFTNVTTNHYIHVTFVQIDGIDDNNILSAVVYPNPTSGEVTIECEGLNHIRIVNTNGQTVYNADHEGEQVRIDLSQMAKGIYMMHIEANGGRAVRKIVIE